MLLQQLHMWDCEISNTSSFPWQIPPQLPTHTALPFDLHANISLTGYKFILPGFPDTCSAWIYYDNIWHQTQYKLTASVSSSSEMTSPSSMSLSSQSAKNSRSDSDSQIIITSWQQNIIIIISLRLWLHPNKIKKYQTYSSPPLRLILSRQVWFVCGWQLVKTVWSSCYTRVISEHFRDTVGHYTVPVSYTHLTLPTKRIV